MSGTESKNGVPGNVFGIWFMQVRGPFLILAIFLSLIGLGAAARDGGYDWWWGVLISVGVILAHTSVNLFNEISDHKTGIDSNTVRTPFSGGSGMMQAGAVQPGRVRFAATLSLILAALIGGICIWRAGWPLLLFIIPGGIAIRFYTTHFTKWGLGEIIAGLTLGSLVVAGSYYVIHSSLNWPVILLSAIPGLLTFQLLFLNEFPDLEADKQGGRNHLVIQLGRRKSSFIYAALMVVVYSLIAVLPVISPLPRILWIAMITLPVAVMAVRTTLKNHSDIEHLIPALGLNVIVVLLTDLLLAIALFVG